MYINTVAQETSKRLLYKVFGLMAGALTITGFTAFGLFLKQDLFARIFSNSAMIIGIVVAQLAIVIALSGFISRLNTSTALLFYFIYSVLVGVTCSSVLYVYTLESVYITFFVCAATFATVALYGYITDADLSAWGNVATMGLFGLIIAMLINLFFRSSGFDLVLSFIGVGIFTVLTAYDMQRIKNLSYDVMRSPEDETRISILGALILYLDFINLFLMLLRIFGRRRD
jgi:FtsH-binding integral membrane protein